MFNVDFASLVDMDMITSGLMCSGICQQFKKDDELETSKKDSEAVLKMGQHACNGSPEVFHFPLWRRMTGWFGWAINATWADNKPLSGSRQVQCCKAEIE